MLGTGEQQLEYILLRKPEVFVYKVPLRDTSGHRAEDWKESIWKGRLQIVGKGDICVIRLLELDSDTLFANCIVSQDVERAVERAVDSSRYFALRLDDGHGRHAIVGIGFPNRSDAFDFVCAIADFHRTQFSSGSEFSSEQAKNFSFAEGELLRLHLKNLPTKSRRSMKSPGMQTVSPSSTVLGLPSPPKSLSRRSPRKDTKDSSERRDIDPSELSCPSIDQNKSQTRKPKGEEGNHEAFERAFGTLVETNMENETRILGSQRGSVVFHETRKADKDIRGVSSEQFGTGQLCSDTGEAGYQGEGPQSLSTSPSLQSKNQASMWDAFSDEAVAGFLMESQPPGWVESSHNPFADSDNENNGTDSTSTGFASNQ